MELPLGSVNTSVYFLNKNKIFNLFKKFYFIKKYFCNGHRRKWDINSGGSTYYFVKFCRKLHENESISIMRGTSLVHPLGSAND